MQCRFSCGKRSPGLHRIYCGELSCIMASVAAQSQFNTHPRSIRSAGPVTLGTVLLSLALAAAVLAVYWPVRTHPFLPNDDNFYITDNPYMHKGVNWATIRWAFT